MSEYREGVLYPHNVLEGFSTGALLDLRVRMAARFIETSQLFNSSVVEVLPTDAAVYALDLAEALTAEAEKRGWINVIPVGTELDGVLRDQAARTAKFQATQQLEGNKFAEREMSGRVMPAGQVMNG